MAQAPIAHKYRVTTTDLGVLRKVEALDAEDNVLCELIVTGVSQRHEALNPGVSTLDVYSMRVEYVKVGDSHGSS